MPPKIVLVYVTAPSVAVARKLARQLMRDGMVACANILPGMQSLYPWKGRVESAREAVLLLKTRKSAFARLEKRLRQLHPYDVPCVLEMPVDRVSLPYARWLLESLKRKL